MRAGKATKPLGLPLNKPKCFDTQKQWREYRELAEYCAGDGFTYCTDCTPENQAEMLKQNRCAHPEAKFVKIGTIIVGRRK